MNEPNIEPLILDLIEWLAARVGTHDEVMDVGRTLFSRLTAWEDPTERRLVETEQQNDRYTVRPTAAWLALLIAKRLRSNVPLAL